MSRPPAPSPTSARSNSSTSPSSGHSCTPAATSTPPGGRTSGCSAVTPAPLAGPGAPLVDEYAPASLAAALGLTLDAGRALIADALELTYRLPRLWDLVMAGLVAVWRARQISRETHDLDTEAVAFADRLICSVPAKVRLVDAARLVDEARLYYDPDRAVADEEHELARRGVWVRHTGHPATTDVFMTLDTPDALLFDQTIGRIAHELHALGDTDTTDVRRARAVGILADPQYALDLMSGREGAAPTRGATGASELYLHLSPADLVSDGVGAVSIEKLGAMTTRLLTDWLARHSAVGGQTQPATRPGPLHREGRRPARPTLGDARARDPARQPLRLPRLPTRLPVLRPRPHHPLRATRRGRSAGPDDAG